MYFMKMYYYECITCIKMYNVHVPHTLPSHSIDVVPLKKACSKIIL